MDKKLQNKLFKKYSKIFRQKDLPMSQTALCWGIDCPDSWYLLIDKLCEKIQSFIKSNKLPFQIEATQVKSKFGGLRFYNSVKWTKAKITEVEIQKFNIYGETIEGMISFAEHLSYSICEECGVFNDTVKSRNINGWWTTLCNECSKKKEKTK